MQWITCTHEVFENEDWMNNHYRYKFSNDKLDTDLFEVRDGGLMKIGGDGRLEFTDIEYLDETVEDMKEDCVMPIIGCKKHNWFGEHYEKCPLC